MTTIRQAIEPKLIERAEARLVKLQQLDSPKAIVEAQLAAIAKGNLADKVGHIADFGDQEFSATEPRKYRRGYGVRFTLVSGTQVDMIPGPYGLFLSEVK